MIKAIFTDFFGVLHNDTLNEWTKQHGLKRAGIIAELSQQFDVATITHQQFFRGLAREVGSTGEAVETEFINMEKLDKPMVELMKKLGRTYKLVLISNSGEIYLQRILDSHALTHYFDHILISGKEGIAKPDTRLFKKALNLCNVEPQEAIFIDDRKSNLAGAEQSGIRPIHFESYEQLVAELTELNIG